MNVLRIWKENKEPFMARGPIAKCPRDDVEIEITDEAGVVLVGTEHRIVGERIALYVQARLSLRALSSIRWAVDPAVAVKGYTQTASRGAVAYLDERDLTAEALIFHFIAGGTHELRVSAIVEGRRKWASVTMVVAAPTKVEMAAVTRPIQIVNKNTLVFRGG